VFPTNIRRRRGPFTSTLRAGTYRKDVAEKAKGIGKRVVDEEDDEE